MIKIHLLSGISSEIISYWMQIHPIQQFPLTIYEAQLFNNINIFHSNRFLQKNNQLDYSILQSSSITPFITFSKFYQSIYSNSQSIHSNQLRISSSAIKGIHFFYNQRFNKDTNIYLIHYPLRIVLQNSHIKEFTRDAQK